jgi:hypothetical protein
MYPITSDTSEGYREMRRKSIDGVHRPLQSAPHASLDSAEHAAINETIGQIGDHRHAQIS